MKSKISKANMGNQKIIEHLTKKVEYSIVLNKHDIDTVKEHLKLTEKSIMENIKVIKDDMLDKFNRLQREVTNL